MEPLSLAVAGSVLVAPVIAGVRRLVAWVSGDPSSSARYALGAASELLPALDASWQRWDGARPELRGAPRNSILAVNGLADQPPIVRATLLDVAEALGIPVDSLATVIAHESGWRASATNPLQAFGLIQLTPGAKLPGFIDAAALAAVPLMSPVDQLQKIAKPYFLRFGERAQHADPGILAMLNFLPKYAGKEESYVLAKRGGDVYQANANAFDRAGKGYFTIGDVYDSFAKTAAAANGKRIAVDGSIINGTSRSGAPMALAEPKAAPALPAPSAPAAAAPAPKVPAASAPKAPAASAPRGGTAIAPKGAPAPTRGKSFYDITSPDDVVAADDPNAFWHGTDAPKDAPKPPAYQIPKGKSYYDQTSPDDRVAADDPNAAWHGSDPDGEPFGGQVMSGLKQFGSALKASGAGDDARGVLLAAVRAGAHRPVAFMELDIPEYDITVTILRDALQANVDGQWLRLGVTYPEQVDICRLLGLISPTKEIVDRAWEYAKAQKHVIQPVGLVQSPADYAQMQTLTFARRHNVNIERALAQAGAQPDEFWRPYGKAWIVHPRMVQPDSKGVVHGVVEYGGQQPNGKPIQGGGPFGPDAGGHDTAWLDYSMVAADLVQRRARRISDPSATVDLVDVYRELFPGDDMAGAIEVYR